MAVYQKKNYGTMNKFKSMGKTKKILICASGTGGHILPALAIAKQIKHIDKTVRVEFVCGSSALEKNLYSQYDFTTHFLSVGRLRKNVRPSERIKTFISLPIVLLKAFRILIKTKPLLVVGMGGAVSGPVLLAGALLRKRTVIFEFNAVLGLANRFLSRIVDEAIVFFPEAKEKLKTKKQTVFPFPVRPEISQIPLKGQISSPLRVLVLGGSQGASTINKVVSDFIVFDDEARRFSFTHQTGAKEFTGFKKKYSVYDCKNVRVFAFLHNIHEVYQWADVVISRAGIGVIAEISCAGRAGVLVPLPSSADQHQLKNAKIFDEKSAGLLIEEPDFTKKRLKSLLQDLINNPQKIKQLSERARSLKIGAPADNIAKHLLNQQR